MQFKLWLEVEDTDEIVPNDLYDFYFIYTALVNDKLLDEYLRPVEFRINEIKQKYLENFSKLLLNQLSKYLKRGRYSSSYNVDVIASLPLLDQFRHIDNAMRQTFRSDMRRRNENWEYITENLSKLASTNNITRVMYHIDRINNAIHNTKELVLDKLYNGYQLLQALDLIHNSKTPKDYVKFTSKEIAKLVNLW